MKERSLFSDDNKEWMFGGLCLTSGVIFFSATEPGVITLSAMTTIVAGLGTRHFHKLRRDSQQSAPNSDIIQEPEQGEDAFDRSDINNTL